MYGWRVLVTKHVTSSSYSSNALSKLSGTISFKPTRRQKKYWLPYLSRSIDIDQCSSVLRTVTYFCLEFVRTAGPRSFFGFRFLVFGSPRWDKCLNSAVIILCYPCLWSLTVTVSVLKPFSQSRSQCRFSLPFAVYYRHWCKITKRRLLINFFSVFLPRELE